MCTDRRLTVLPPLRRLYMKRIALVAAILAVTACTAKKDDAAVTDTAAPAMAPAPAATDTGMAMTDTAKKDTTVADTTKK